MDDETRRVGEIEAEIAETRVELSETIEAIQERLTPANIVSNATESVRHAATEKVRQMTDNSFMDTVRANPIPAAMIGIGAAWLYFKGGNRSRDSYRYSDWRGAGGYTPGVSGSTGGTSEYPVGTRGTSGTSAYGVGVEENFGESGGIGTDIAARARNVTGELRDTARDTTRRAQLKFNDVLRDNPLLLGAAAALVGAAVGMSVPATDTENRLMGDARDAVVERAQGAASEAASKVSEAAESVANKAGQVAENASDFSSSTSSTSAATRRGRPPRQV
jgi:Protein of unknown function (DUF3618)